MRHTAWTGSSLPSDRIPSKPKQSPAVSKGKGKQNVQEPPKSKEVVRLENLRDNLKESIGNERDPKGGCFCQARQHALSPYTPICKNCGLILCEIQAPYYACPHCTSPLLLPATRTSLIATLEGQISDTLTKEEADRERALEEARAAAGAFPALSSGGAGAAAPDILASHPQNQAHKVLSLNPKTKQYTVASYTRTPAISRSSSKGSSIQEIVDEPKRVPAPPSEVVHASRDPDPGRPWMNLRGGTVAYVPLPSSAPKAGGSKGRKREKRENAEGSGGKEKGKENQRQTP